MDFLVSRVLTLGFRVGLSHTTSSTTVGTGGEGGSSTSSSSSTDVSGSLTLGVLFSPSRVVSLWPNIGGGIQHDFDGSGFTWVTNSTEFALLLHPAHHFFIALKPGVRGSRPLEGTNPEFTFSQVFNTGIGGWW
jgi:hypothetical protein